MKRTPEQILAEIHRIIRKTKHRVILCTCAVSVAVALNAGLLADAYINGANTTQALLRAIGAGAAALSTWYTFKAWQHYLTARKEYTFMKAAHEKMQSRRQAAANHQGDKK